MKKNILIIVASSFILVILIALINKNNSISKNEVISLIKKGMSIENVYYEQITYTDSNSDNESNNKLSYSQVWWKDNINVIKKYPDNQYIWYNFTAEEKICFMHDLKRISVTSESNSINQFNNKDYIESMLFKDKRYKYIIKREKYFGVNCISTEIKYNIDDTKGFFWVKFWFDEESGLIIREEKYRNHDSIKPTKPYEYSEYFYTFNCVTDEDIRKPNILDYPDYIISDTRGL